MKVCRADASAIMVSSVDVIARHNFQSPLSLFSALSNSKIPSFKSDAAMLVIIEPMSCPISLFAYNSSAGMLCPTT
jgi:hypothetical protein